MQKGKQLIGMPVVTVDSRQEIEHIRGLVLDPSETRVSGLLVDCDYSSRHARVISLRNVRSFGTSEIAVSSPRVINDVVQIPDRRYSNNRDISLTRTQLVSGDGTEVGTVEDVIFNEMTGKIQSFQCLKEPKKTKRAGNAVLPLYDELDSDVIVHASEVRQLEKPGPSITYYAASDDRSKIHQANHKVTENEASIEHAKRFLTAAGSRMQHNLTSIQRMSARFWKGAKGIVLAGYQTLLQAIENHRIKRVCGRIATSDLYDAKEEKVVAHGELINSATIDRARKAGVLKELLDAMNRRAEHASSKRDGKQFGGLLDDWWPPFI